jgi:hypothetical protein
MVNYEFLKATDYKLFLEYVKRGIISVHIMDYLTVYETYLHELKTNKKSIAITYCAEKYNCSERTIHNVINFMLR